MSSLDSDDFQVRLALTMNVFCPNKPLLTVVCWVRRVTWPWIQRGSHVSLPTKEHQIRCLTFESQILLTHTKQWVLTILGSRSLWEILLFSPGEEKIANIRTHFLKDSCEKSLYKADCPLVAHFPNYRTNHLGSVCSRKSSIFPSPPFFTNGLAAASCPKSFPPTSVHRAAK